MHFSLLLSFLISFAYLTAANEISSAVSILQSLGIDDVDSTNVCSSGYVTCQDEKILEFRILSDQRLNGKAMPSFEDLPNLQFL